MAERQRVSVLTVVWALQLGVLSQSSAMPTGQFPVALSGFFAQLAWYF